MQWCKRCKRRQLCKGGVPGRNAPVKVNLPYAFNCLVWMVLNLNILKCTGERQ
jgi:hypothetical protein